MRKKVTATLTTAAAAVALAAAGASPAQADSVGGFPCGLSGDGYNYVIANCNYFAVDRRIIKNDNTRGTCRHIDARSWVVGYTSVGYYYYEGC